MRIEELISMLEQCALSSQHAYNARNNLHDTVKVTHKDLIFGLNLMKNLSVEGKTMFEFFMQKKPSYNAFFGGLNGSSNVKKFKRGIQLMCFLCTGDDIYIQASVRTAILAFLFRLADGDITDRVIAINAVGRYGLSSLSPLQKKAIDGVKRVIDVVSANSSPTQLSVAYGNSRKGETGGSALEVCHLFNADGEVIQTREFWALMNNLASLSAVGCKKLYTTVKGGN